VTKRDKREERIRNNPKAVTFEELDWLLRQYGFVEVRRKGSHAIYRHPTDSSIAPTVPFLRPYLRSRYVKQIIQWIDSNRDDESQQEQQ
jgi:predicted RNA binding protein YcfA (HicA-like mRNA interferase family)